MGNLDRSLAGCSDEFLEGKIVAKNLKGHDLIFIRRLGKVLIFKDECTHQPIKLSEFGELTGGLLLCHAHAGVFDIDHGGDVVASPPCEALTAFVCEEQAGQVYVFLK